MYVYVSTYTYMYIYIDIFGCRLAFPLFAPDATPVQSVGQMWGWRKRPACPNTSAWDGYVRLGLSSCYKKIKTFRRVAPLHQILGLKVPELQPALLISRFHL